MVRLSSNRLSNNMGAGSISFSEQPLHEGKTVALRNKISTFKQIHDEPFCDAWERFNNYRRDCSHHRFDNDYLLGVFYDGVSLEKRNQLDSSSNGDFMTQTTEGAFALIKNMASSSANKNPEADCSTKVNSVDTSKIDELSAKVDQLIMINQNHVFIMEESSLEQSAKDTASDTDKPTEDQQEVSYVNGKGWQFNNYHSNPNVRKNPHLFNHNNGSENPAEKTHNTGYQKFYPKIFLGQTFVLNNSGNQHQNLKP